MKQCREKEWDAFQSSLPSCIFLNRIFCLQHLWIKFPSLRKLFLSLIPLGHTKEQYHVFERINLTNDDTKQHWLPFLLAPWCFEAPSKVFSSSNVYFPGCNTQYMTLKLKSVPLPVNISSVFWYVCYVLNPKAFKKHIFILCVHLQMQTKYKVSSSRCLKQLSYSVDFLNLRKLEHKFKPFLKGWLPKIGLQWLAVNLFNHTLIKY